MEDLFERPVQEVKSSGVRIVRTYWLWWLKEELLRMQREFLLKYTPVDREPEADQPIIVESKPCS